MQEPQVREEVDHLLLPEVPATGRPVRGQPDAAKLLLVALRVSSSGEEDNDLARLRLPRVDELPRSLRYGTRLSPAPVLTGVPVARLLRDEKLDGMAEDRVCELGRRGKRLELVAERPREQIVDRGEHLRPRAVVRAQGQEARGLRPAFSKHPDVRMAEPVDRLELVADREDLRQLGMRDQVDQLALEEVRVLELVDHHELEPQPHCVSDRLVVAEQIPGRQLEIFEVDGGLSSLGGGILAGEAHEQLLEEIPVGCSELLQRSELEAFPRLFVGRCTRAPTLQRGEIDHSLGQDAWNREPHSLRRVATLCLRRSLVGRERLGLDAKSRHGMVEARTLTELQHEITPCRAQRLVDACEHAPKTARSVRREKPQPVGLAGRAEPLERALEGLSAQHRCSRLVQLPEARIQPYSERMRPQDAVAETVDGRDPCAV